MGSARPVGQLSEQVTPINEQYERGMTVIVGPGGAFASSNKIVTSQQVIISLRVTYPDPLDEGRTHEASCERGTGAAPAGKGLTQPSSPGRTRAASPATTSRPGPTTVKGQKLRCRVGAPQGAGRDASRPGPGVPGPPRALRNSGPVWRNPGHAPCGAPSPSISRETEERHAGDPWPRAANRGRFSFDFT